MLDLLLVAFFGAVSGTLITQAKFPQQMADVVIMITHAKTLLDQRHHQLAGPKPSFKAIMLRWLSQQLGNLLLLLCRELGLCTGRFACFQSTDSSGPADVIPA